MSSSKTDLIAVCISRRPETLSIDLPFYNLAGDIPWPENPKKITFDYGNAWLRRELDSSQKYIAYLAAKRNRAVTEALEKYPSTKNVLLVDSYYLHQKEALARLITDYGKIDDPLILGGAVWGRMRTRISHLLTPPRFEGRDWYDKWGVPELRWVPRKWRPENDWLAFRFRVPLAGLYRTNHVSGVFIFPVTVWKNGARFGAPSDNHCVELSGFTDDANLPIYIDFNASFERGIKYSVQQCIRTSLALGRFVPGRYERKRLQNAA